MPLSAVKVLELNEKYNLIENLCERELENPEGCGLDIRVGEVYKIKGSSFLGIEKRSTPKIEKIADVKEDGEGKKITMNPGDYFLVRTIEKVNTPKDKIDIEDGMPSRYLMPVVYPRSTLQRCGIKLLATKTDPGYSGNLIFGLANLRNEKFEFELGARMFNIVFEPVIGEIKRAYEGQWNNGRVSTNGTERQV